VINTTNPYQIGVASDYNLNQKDVSGQINQFKTEEDKSKAPLIMPFPLENTIVPAIGEIFVSLTQIRNNLVIAKSNPKVNKDGVNVIVKKIDTINKYLLDLQSSLRTITL
jgi:hypothetical protein